MKSFYLVLLALFAISCGRAKDGQDGANGNSPNCFIETLNDASYLICTNPDGTRSRTEIKNGEDGANGSNGQDAITKEITCEYRWELSGAPAGRYYNISYTVLKSAKGASIATLLASYHTQTDTTAENALTTVWSKASGFNDLAPVSSALWFVRLDGETKARLTRVPFKEERTIPCK